MNEIIASPRALDRLSVSGYRRLFSVDVELRSLQVMVGANGVGKTSLLEVVRLLSESASGHLQSTLSDLGGITDVMTRNKAQSLHFDIRKSVEGYQPIEYSLDIRPNGADYLISTEILQQYNHGSEQRPFTHIDSRGSNIKFYDIDNGQLYKPTWTHDDHETSLFQVPKMFRAPEELRHQLASAVLYAALDVGRRSPVRLPQPMKPTTLPGTNGEDLISHLFNLRESFPDRFELVEDTLKAAFPSTFEKLSFPPVAAGTLAMTWKDPNFTDVIYAHQLSEGTLRFLWLTALLYSPKLPSITMIDEPEVSLHPNLLRLLAEMLREASQHTQLFVATHSDTLIRFLEPKEVLVCDSQDGMSSMSWADKMNLDGWLSDYSLDQLWSMNVMGGNS